MYELLEKIIVICFGSIQHTEPLLLVRIPECQPFMELLGGYIIIALTGMIKTSDYLTGLQFAFNGYYITYSIIKTAVFSFIISSISAYYGYWAKGGSLGVGRSATKAIVVASALILIFNLILTRIML